MNIPLLSKIAKKISGITLRTFIFRRKLNYEGYIYVAGNDLVREDSMALRVASEISNNSKGFTIIHFDPTEDIVVSDHLVILDTVIGINKVSVFTDMSHFEKVPRNSVHDFDLFTSIQLMMKLKKINKLTLVGIPSTGDEAQLTQEVLTILRSI